MYFSAMESQKSEKSCSEEHFMAKGMELAGVVKVQGVGYRGGGLKYYLFNIIRAYLLKNIKNS